MEVLSLKIYLDNCCYNRPFDDQSQLKISLQTQAKLQIQADALSGKIEHMLDFENGENPFEFKRNSIQKWEHIATSMIKTNDEITKTAKELKTQGLGTMDALHIACAIYAKADYFVTTDDKILNKNISSINIISPIDYING